MLDPNSVALLPLLLVIFMLITGVGRVFLSRVMTGKKMPYQCVEVVVKLKAPPVGLFEGETPGSYCYASPTTRSP